MLKPEVDDGDGEVDGIAEIWEYDVMRCDVVMRIGRYGCRVAWRGA